MTTKQSHRVPADQDKPEGDLTILEKDEPAERTERRPSVIERRDWRGEGVVGDLHTD